MATRIGITLGAMALALALPEASQAQIVRRVAGGTQTIRCGGQTVEINGAGATVTLLGQCPRVEVNGTGITVKVEVAGIIDIDGVGNTVVWERAASGGRPRVDTDGVGNTVRQGTVVERSAPEETAASGAAETSSPARPAARAGGSPVVVSDNHHVQTIDCAGAAVTVDGNGNTLVLNGECPTVEINGNGNVVRIEAAGSISTMGNRNTVTWTRGVGASSPQVSNLGTGNSVTKIGE